MSEQQRGARRPTGRHLGDRAAALVDGDLLGEQRDRALAHVAGCDPCRDALAVQRVVRSALRSAPAAEPGPDLLALLLALPTRLDEREVYPGDPGEARALVRRPPSDRHQRRGLTEPTADRPPPRRVRAIGPRAPRRRRLHPIGSSGRHRAGAFVLGAVSLLTATMGSVLAGAGSTGSITTPSVTPGPQFPANQASLFGGTTAPSTAELLLHAPRATAPGLFIPGSVSSVALLGP